MQASSGHCPTTERPDAASVNETIRSFVLDHDGSWSPEARAELARLYRMWIAARRESTPGS